jgi:hypothetical protein
VRFIGGNRAVEARKKKSDATLSEATLRTGEKRKEELGKKRNMISYLVLMVLF